MSLPEPRELAVRPEADRVRQMSQEFRERMARRLAGDKIKPPKLPPLPKPPPVGKTHLIIGDSHSDPTVANHRYDWLGRLITDPDIKPDLVVDIGDWWDLHSLNRYDRPGSRSFEGSRYWRDIEHGIEAMERVQAQLDAANRGQSKPRRPRFIRTLGNHESRISRLLEEEPRWEGMIGLHDLMSKEFGWEEYPYQEPVLVDGVVYCHNYPSGVMGRAIGGMHQAASLLRLQHHTAVAGHSHTRDYCERVDATGQKLQALFTGCYFGHELEWAGPAVNKMYSRGLTILRNVKDGTFEPEWLGYETIHRRYS